jgi:hypothetical protein
MERVAVVPLRFSDDRQLEIGDETVVALQHLSALRSSRAQIFSVRSSSEERARPQAIIAE